MIGVLGGGPAGRTAAMKLALSGRDVTLVERAGLGGQCLHHGCMVICALNDVARAISQARNLASLGILDSVPTPSFPRTVSQMASVQKKIASVLDAETRGCGVHIVRGEGKVDADRLTVDGETLETSHLVVATGSVPRVPAIPGVETPGVYTAHTFTSMPDVPDRLLIVGGGVMAAEFAFIFQEWGSEVTLAVRSTFLREVPRRLREAARGELLGVDVRENCTVERISGEERVRGAVLRAGNAESEIACDAVILAAGLVPNSGMVSGLRKGKDGRIVVNRRMETSVPGVYACGDVTGSPCLTPVARQEGIVAASSILGENLEMDYGGIPRSFALSQEYAFVEGEPGEEMVAFAAPGPAGPGTFWEVPRGRTGMAEVVASREDGRVRGISVASPVGGTVAAYVAFLMREGIPVRDFSRFTEVHPSSDGVSPLMKYAASRLGARQERERGD
ncbi:MAG: NAD(P)/FAD-dependent oxidoreductase [Methanolinea sp.]